MYVWILKTKWNSYFVSYRDHNLKETNEIYEGIYEYLKNFDEDERDMTKYVIGAISNLDTPRTPRTKGNHVLCSIYYWNPGRFAKTKRNEILGVTKEDIRGLADIVKTILDGRKYLCYW